MEDRLQISDDPRGQGVFPVVLTTAIFVLLCLEWLRDEREGVLWGVLFAALQLVLVLWSVSRMRGVSADERFLYLSNGREEEVVLLADVIDVHGSGATRSRSVSLRYRSARGKPRWIWFRAPRGEALYPASREPHPAVEELQRRIARF